ncbi:hypothetical protein PLICRDRAFT_175706 [Plicaturopsis crispa FD-325 SS-3]|nr:hypothetical protein PLICRDRAFT_175706 [Plicaturopsis crispa FD-325 SS-3]
MSTAVWPARPRLPIKPSSLQDRALLSLVGSGEGKTVGAGNTLLDLEPASQDDEDIKTARSHPLVKASPWSDRRLAVYVLVWLCSFLASRRLFLLPSSLGLRYLSGLGGGLWRFLYWRHFSSYCGGFSVNIRSLGACSV